MYLYGVCMQKILTTIIGLLWSLFAWSQAVTGVVSGILHDEGNSPLAGATIQLRSWSDTLFSRTAISDKTGAFQFDNVPFGFYRVQMSYSGMQTLIVDTVHVRSEKPVFSWEDLVMRNAASTNLREVVIVAEKPLIQTKDGNITFNASESPLAAGASASELLEQVPLVTKDGDGKVSVRGKEPRILIDDKPVELNLAQLQDLLESLPGSAIEKIEVMVNPPPQYANEQGGVINIVMKKGRVGKTGRISLSGGTRGESNLNGGFNYRRQGFVFSLNAGIGYNVQKGEGYSSRQNIYTDSSNFFNTTNSFRNQSLRPNLRASADMDLNRFQTVNAVLQLNYNDYDNNSLTTYANINRMGELYRLSERHITNQGDNLNGSFSVSYLTRTLRPGEQFRFIASANRTRSKSDRDFYQQFFNPDHTPNGIDSTQEQLNSNINTGYSLRISYDRPLAGTRTFLSTGAFYNRSVSDIAVDASYLKKPEMEYHPLDLLSNFFDFYQGVLNLRTSVRQVLAANLSVTAGLSAEQTDIHFDLKKTNAVANNRYWTLLPFANFNKSWEDKFNLTFAYRRSIRRPGINELNPTIDFSDPYNIRFGNEKLKASTADNFDLVLARTRQRFFINLGLGYNKVKNIFSRVRTLLEDGKTQVSWENISGRSEYEVSTWGGITLQKKLRVNLSASYTYNAYSEFDRTVNRYRNGGSFTSTASINATPSDVWSITGGFNVNRFANPQGYGRWAVAMNAGVQRRFFNKRLTTTLNFIDPFRQQRNKNITYGSNFYLESTSTTFTRNVRLTIAYNLTKPVKKGIKV